MKPWAASCAVGSELGLLFTFHKSSEPVNLACKASGPMFNCSSDSLGTPALLLPVELLLDTLCFTFPDQGGRPHCFTIRRGGSDYVLKCECVCVCAYDSACLHVCVCLHIVP